MFRPIIETQLQQIMELSYKINSDAQVDSVPKNLPAVIIKFNGASGWLDIWIYPDGKVQLPMRHFFKDVDLSKDNASVQLEEVIKMLEFIYHNKKVKEKEYNDGK